MPMPGEVDLQRCEKNSSATVAIEQAYVQEEAFSYGVAFSDAQHAELLYFDEWTSGTSLADASGMKRRPVVRRSLVLDAGLDKLQAFLLLMMPGDEVSVSRAVEISGLEAAQCDAVLETLTRAGLMIRLQHDAYVRQPLA